jgi:hypothetical protein
MTISIPMSLTSRVQADFHTMINDDQRPWYYEGPREGPIYVRLRPLGAWSWSGPGFFSGTGTGFSVDDDFQAYPLSCERFSYSWPGREKHAGLPEALRVTRPKAVI